MLKEAILIALVFGAGFLFLIPGPALSPSAVSILKKNVTAMENLAVLGTINSTGRIHAYDGIALESPISDRSNIYFNEYDSSLSRLSSFTGAQYLTGSHEYQLSTQWDPYYDQEVYAVIGDAGIWTNGKYITNPKCFDAVAYYDGAVYSVITDEACMTRGTGYPVLVNTTDMFYVDMGSHYTVIHMNIEQPGVDITLKTEYYNSTSASWQAIDIDYDGTENLNHAGDISFIRPTDMGAVTIPIIIYIPHRPPITFHQVLNRPIRFTSTTVPTTIPTAYTTTPDDDDRLDIFANAYDPGPSLSVDHEGNILGGSFSEDYISSSQNLCLYGDQAGTPAFLVNASNNYDVSIGNTVLGYQTNIRLTGTISTGEEGFPGCLQMRDTDGSNWTRCTTLAGVLTCVIGTC